MPTPERWQDGQMALRWIAAGMEKVAKQFRPVNGHYYLPRPAGRMDATINAVKPSKEDAA